MNNMNNIIKQMNLYKNSHPNLVNCWTNYIELKKKNYESTQYYTGLLIDINDNEYYHYNIILNYLKNGYDDFTIANIMLIFIYKLSLLDDELLHNII